MSSVSFTLGSFLLRFSDSDSCLQFYVDLRYKNGIFCKRCKAITKFYKVENRKVYQCSCGYQVSPLAGTIFHKSSTPLEYWFYAIFVMSATRSGVSARQLQRELGVTYKTSWRMLKQIRTCMNSVGGELLKGVVEIDETYIGGAGYWREKVWWQNWEEHPKEIVMGFVERGGRIKTKHVADTSDFTLISNVKNNVDQSAQVYTDQLYAYRKLPKYGYKHDSVMHKKHYVRGDVYTQNIEGFWSHLKRGLRGVYRNVSPKYLQSYTDEFAFRYNYRKEPDKIFEKLLIQTIA